MSSLDTINELDQILKDTEFENSQQLKSIESEKERIQAYEEKINEWELNISKLKADIIVRDERRVNLSKQHANNRANIESLKQTSLVLADHEEALKKKLQHNLEKLEHDKGDQCAALAKYGTIWKKYEAFYDGMEQVHEAKLKKKELQLLKDQSTVLESRIEELEATLKQVRREKEVEKMLVPWILKIAMLRVETMKNVSKLQNEKSLVLSMKAKVKQLQEEQAEREQNRLKELAIARELEELQSNYAEDMPQSCVEPLEKAVQIPIIRVTDENSTPVPSKPTPSPRYRLELPQLSFPTRRSRNQQSSSLTAPKSNLLEVPSVRAPFDTPKSSMPRGVTMEPGASNTSAGDMSLVSAVRAPSTTKPSGAVGGSTAQVKPSLLHVSRTTVDGRTQADCQQPSRELQTNTLPPKVSAFPQARDSSRVAHDDFQFKVPTEAPRQVKAPSNPSTGNVQPAIEKIAKDGHTPHGQNQELAVTTVTSADDMEWNSIPPRPSTEIASLPLQCDASAASTPPITSPTTVADGAESTSVAGSLFQGTSEIQQSGDGNQQPAWNGNQQPAWNGNQQPAWNQQLYGKEAEDFGHGAQQEEQCQQMGCEQQGQYGKRHEQFGQGREQFGQGHEQYGQGLEQFGHGYEQYGQMVQYEQDGPQEQAQYRQELYEMEQYGQCTQHSQRSGQVGRQQQEKEELQHQQQSAQQEIQDQPQQVMMMTQQQPANQDPFGIPNNQFTAEQPFSFGFGQSTGSAGGFGGGFGLFGGQQDSVGASSFGAGFSFGGSTPSQNGNSGFNLNFGSEQSAGSGSKFNMFNF